MRNSAFLGILLALAVPVLTSSGLTAGGKRVVFIGDSITDGNWGNVYNYKKTSAERSQTDMNHIYGHSYVMLIASDIQSSRPRSGYSFFNRGFSGHKLCDLAARWQEDVLDLHPDILSVLVGTNDIHAWLMHGRPDTAACCSRSGTRILPSGWSFVRHSSQGRAPSLRVRPMTCVSVLPAGWLPWSVSCAMNMMPSASLSILCSINLSRSSRPRPIGYGTAYTRLLPVTAGWRTSGRGRSGYSPISA